MTVISSNSSALRAQNGARVANQMMQTAMARLSSGNRINSASDDAAGLAISNSMGSQIGGMNQAIRNSNDGISLAQTADGTLSEVTNNLQRIRELAVQSASGTYSDSDRTNMQAEVSALTTQISSSLSGATFNGVSLFTTTAGGAGTTIDIQTGSNSSASANQVSIKIDNLDISKIVPAATPAAATAVTPASGSTPAIAGTFDVSNETGAAGEGVTNATKTIDSVDALLSTVNTVRAGLGASESRLNSVVNNLTNNVTNLTDAKSSISDADFSVETTNLAKAQILNQAATAMLAQANQSQQGVLKLLQ